MDTGESNAEPTPWWGTFPFEEDTGGRWDVGPSTLWLYRSAREWRLLHRPSPDPTTTDPMANRSDVTVPVPDEDVTTALEAVGDVIRVGGTTGEVLSIDLLSVKLRTFDNLFVRIPNETMIKSEITNLRRFPIRRVDLQVGVAYKEDLREVREVLMEVADHNPLCLEEPTPLIIFQGFGDFSLNLQFSVWGTTENFLELRNSIPVEIKEAFDERDIEIPFPHRTLYTGSVTDPFPVRTVDAPPDAGERPEGRS